MIRRVLIAIAALALVAATASGQDNVRQLLAGIDEMQRQVASLQAARDELVPLPEPRPTLRETPAETPAETAPAARPAEILIANICRIQCGSSVGSGVYLGDVYCLSANHVFRGERTDNCVTTFPLASNTVETRRGRVIRSDPHWDQALVMLEAPPSEAPGVRLTDRNVEPGDPVVAIGYQFGREFMTRPGTMKHRTYPSDPSREPGDWCVMSGESISGMSGGPVFDRDGLLVGNLWGAGDGETVFCNAGRTVAFLQPVWPQLQEHARLMGWGSGPAGSVCQPGGTRTMVRPAPSTTCAPPTRSPVQVQIDYQKILDMMAADARFRGPAGAPGPPGQDGQSGPQGLQGPQGEPGAAADVSALAGKLDAILARLERLERQPQPPSGSKLTKIHVDSSGRIYATYDDATQEVVGDLPWIRTRDGRGQLYYEIVPRK